MNSYCKTLEEQRKCMIKCMIYFNSNNMEQVLSCIQICCYFNRLFD